MSTVIHRNGASKDKILASNVLMNAGNNKNDTVQKRIEDLEAGGGGGGSIVSVDPILTEGEHIADIIVNDNVSKIFAPENKIVDVRVNNTSVVNANKVANINLIHANTEEYWNSQVDLIGEANHLYIYTDHSQIDGHNIPALKVGDGLGYLIDAPFIDSDAATLYHHIRDLGIHITDEERAFWNDKVTCYLSLLDGENVVFTKNLE